MTWRTSFHRVDPGAPAEAIDRLRAAAPVALPVQYFELLEFANGGEWHVSQAPFWFSLQPAEWIAEVYEATHWKSNPINEFLKGFVLIGTNGAGECVGFDIRGPEPWPIVLIDVDAEEEERVTLIAEDFDAFLEMLGD
jgi:hypothetical protein